MATERQVLAIVDEIVKSVERAADLPDDSEPVSTLLGRFGEDASAGRTEEWRNPSSSSGDAGPAEIGDAAHLPSGDEDDGSKQQVWTKTLKALRHFAADKVAGKTLMERGFHDSLGQLEGVEGSGLPEENGWPREELGEPWSQLPRGPKCARHAGGCGGTGRAPTCSGKLREREQGTCCSTATVPVGRSCRSAPGRPPGDARKNERRR